MSITASAVLLNVADPAASAAFAARHLGFREEMAADGFVSMSRPDAGYNLISSARGSRRSSPSRCAERPTAC